MHKAAKKRIRHTPEDNYFGIFDGEVTYRFALDSTEIKYMRYPDLSDVSIASKCLAGCQYCAPAGTEVATSTGSKPIEEVKIGEEVYVNTFARKPVDQIHVRHYEGRMYNLQTVDGHRLSLTPNHKVVTMYGEVAIENLELHDWVFDRVSNRWTQIYSIGYCGFEGLVYNLGVKDIHYYFANNLLICNCYTSAVKTGQIYNNVCEKLEEVYGSMDPNYRPFQVAYGGEGEPTLHPEFGKIMQKTRELEICPNYTTNGMHLSEEVLRATRDYCGGVAVSLHPHLGNTWNKALNKLLDYGVENVVLHVIVGQPGTTDLFYKLLDEHPRLKYVVALPYQVSGRADDIDTRDEWLKFFDIAFQRDDRQRMPIGALFYDFLIKENIGLNEISLHEPEKYSGYRIMSDDRYKVLLKSSYNPIPKFND